MNFLQPGLAGGLLQGMPDLVAFLVDGGDRQSGRYAQSDQRRFGKLQARLDGFRNRVRCTERIEVTGMIGVAGTRDNEDIRPHLAHMRDHLIDLSRRVDGDDDACCCGKPAGLQKIRIGRVAVINVMSVAAIARDRRRVGIGGDIGNAVLL